MIFPPMTIHAHQLHGTTKHPAHGATLTYYIKQGLLVGTAGGKPVRVLAFSGGGGGSKTGWVQKGTANNPAMAGHKTSGGHKDHKHHSHGGPIPPGQYTIRTPDGKHPNLGPISAALTPSSHNHMHGRAGFFIHGRGPHGSDGCIVPHTDKEFHALMRVLTESQGGSLTVVDSR